MFTCVMSAGGMSQSTFAGADRKPGKRSCPIAMSAGEQEYRTGATEWDDLGKWERKRRIAEVLELSIVFCVPFSIIGLVAYFALHRSKALSSMLGSLLCFRSC